MRLIRLIRLIGLIRLIKLIGQMGQMQVAEPRRLARLAFGANHMACWNTPALLKTAPAGRRFHGSPAFHRYTVLP